MDRLRFGSFLAPHHPLGESPTLLLRRDLDLVEQLDRLGYDELWCGEHHSSGWETIASPEMFLAAAGERTGTIRLGTGVVSLPYHHPFHVAQRIVQLDHMTRGRAMFGSGPGALPSDALTLGVDPMLIRDRQDEALGVILRLLAGEDRFTYESDWFTLRDAALQILPLQEHLPVTVASSISPSGMQLAGKYGIGVLSIASNSTEGIQALPTQWSFAEESAAVHGQQVDRRRLAGADGVAPRRGQGAGPAGGRRRPAPLAQRVQRAHPRPAGRRVGSRAGGSCSSRSPTAASDGAGAAVIGTPDELVAAIRHLYELTGGFGVVLGFAHDWANREATARSWDLVARYVIPELNGQLRPLRASAEHLHEHKAELMAGASAAVMQKILANPRAADAMAVTMQQIAARRASRPEPDGRCGRSGTGRPADEPAAVDDAP